MSHHSLNRFGYLGRDLTAEFVVGKYLSRHFGKFCISARIKLWIFSHYAPICIDSAFEQLPLKKDFYKNMLDEI